VLFRSQLDHGISHVIITAIVILHALEIEFLVTRSWSSKDEGHRDGIVPNRGFASLFMDRGLVLLPFVLNYQVWVHFTCG
jgi:hypothetical protein